MVCNLAEYTSIHYLHTIQQQKVPISTENYKKLSDKDNSDSDQILSEPTYEDDDDAIEKEIP